MKRLLPVAAVVVLAGMASLSAQTPSFRADGPLPVSAASYPFGAADHTRSPSDLRKVGYVEEEFLFSGLANVYDWPAPGPAVVRTANAPYTTRVLVRRPADRTKFSGTIVVETIFAWPGMGRLTFEAVGRRDYTMIMATTLMFSVLTMVSNLLTDVLYVTLDPRIRLD